MSKPINIKMSKPRGRFSLHIFTDPEDSHFCRAELRNKDGEVKAHHFFIRPDLAQWLSMYEADGYQPVNNRKSTGHEHKI